MLELVKVGLGYILALGAGHGAYVLTNNIGVALVAGIFVGRIARDSGY